jgi:hypothetical protein
MFDSSRKYELECMRLAGDCAQLASEVHDRTLEKDFLASDVHNRALEIHCRQMAKVWTTRAEQGQYKYLDRELN